MVYVPFMPGHRQRLPKAMAKLVATSPHPHQSLSFRSGSLPPKKSCPQMLYYSIPC